MSSLRSTVREWGSTPAERAEPYGCDEVIDDPQLVLFRAVSVAAPTELVFDWLCQLRVAPYSYDWIDHLGRRSPRRLDAALTDLEVGQRFMTTFRLVSFDEDRSITLESRTGRVGHVAVTYRITSGAGNEGRLVAKIAFTAAPGMVGRLTRRVLPLGDLLMMRKQLLTLKALAERDGHESTAGPTIAS